MVIAIVLRRGSSGYSVSLDRVTAQSGQVTVYYTETRPGPGELVFATIMELYIFVAIPRTNAPVVFHHQVKIRDPLYFEGDVVMRLKSEADADGV